MTTIPLTAADERRRDGLRQMRTVATAALVLAALIFIATLHRNGVWAYLNAAAEAAMVGALADWFAVTALFRHPLGLPIPHTALIPKRKDSFAESLEDFFTGHFLTGDAARERVISSGAVLRAGRWLADEGNARTAVVHGGRLAERVITRIKDDDIRRLLGELVLPRLTAEPVSPVAGSLLQQVVADRVHVPVVDVVLTEAHDWLLHNPKTFMAIISDKVPGWAPSWVGEIVADRAHIEALRWVNQVREDPQHSVRVAIDDLLADLATNLQEDPATMARMEEVKERFFTHPQTTESIVALWQVMRTEVLANLADPDSRLGARLQVELRLLGERVRDDDGLRGRLEQRLADVTASLVDSYAAELAPVITQVISRWDGKEAAERIELHVGRDLQFIRINGTVVGAIAGLVIYSLGRLIGG